MFGAGSSDLAIGISLIMRDQFTGVAASANRALTSLSAGAQASVKSFQEAQRDYNAAGAAIGGAAIGAMGKMLTVGAEFDTTLAYISNIANKKGGVGFEQLSKRALQLGLDSMFSAQQVNDAMKYLAMSGMDTQEIYNNIAGAVALASATMSQLDGKLGTADIMTNVMHAFEIEGTEKNAMWIADVLAKAVTSSNTSLLDLAEAMKYAQSTAHTLGLSVEETAAIIMTLGNAGIQGSMAGTATENMLRYLSRMGDEARSGTRQGQALAKLGLAPSDLKNSEGGLKSITEMFTLIGTQLQGMGNVDALNAMQDMFGVRGARAATLLREISNYSANLNTLNTQSAGTALANQKVQMASLGGLIDELKGSIETFAIVWSNAVKPVVGPMIKFLSQTIERFSQLVQTPVGKFITIFVSGLIVVRTAFMAIRAIMLSIRLLQGSMAAGMISTGAAGTRAVASMTSSTGTYNGLVSSVVANLQRQRVTQAELLALQRQQTAAVLQTVNAENVLTATQRRKVAIAASQAMAMGTQQQLLYGASGVAATAGIGAWLSKRGIGKFTTVTESGRLRDAKTGRFVSPITNTPGYAPVGSTGAIGKFGKFMGKGGGIGAMVGGMALSYGSEAVGRDTGLGKAMDIGSSTLSGASIGAMVGSFVPILGTGLGAIVGGVGGLLYGLYDNLVKVEEAVDSAQAEAKVDMGQPYWQNKEWGDKMRKILTAEDGSTIYSMGGKVPVMADQGIMGPALNGLRRDGGSTKLIINIDGRTMVQENIDRAFFEKTVNLGSY